MAIMKKWTGRLIENLENSKWGLSISIFWIAFLGFARAILEFFLFDYGQYDLTQENYITHRFEIELPLFYFAVFLNASIIIKFFSNKKIEQVMKASLPFYSLILLPPILDRILGNRIPYYYLSDYQLVEAFFRFPAITGVVLWMLLLAGIYVFISSGIKRSLLSMLSLFFLYFIYATTFPVKVAKWLTEFSSFLPLRLQEEFDRYCSIEAILYLLIILVALLLIYWIHNPYEFKGVIKSNFRPLRLTHYLLIAIWGYSLIGDFQPLRLFLFFSTLVAVALAFQFAVFMNDLYDKEIDKVSNRDRGLITTPIGLDKLKEFSLLCAVVSLYIAFFVSSSIFNFILLMLAISFFYSAPPIRFRNYPFSSMFIGLISFLTFLCGYLSQVSRYSLRTDVLIIGCAIAIGMTLGSTLIDLKDLAGDKRAGVKSIPVIFGLEKGKKIVTFLVVIGYIIVASVLFWLNKNYLYTLVIIPASLMTYLLLTFKNTKKHWRMIFAVHYQAIIGAILFQFIKI